MMCYGAHCHRSRCPRRSHFVDGLIVDTVGIVVVVFAIVVVVVDDVVAAKVKIWANNFFFSVIFNQTSDCRKKLFCVNCVKIAIP